MPQVKLKRILASDENIKMLKDVLEPFDEQVLIEDDLFNKIGIFGSGSNKGQTRYPVLADNAKVGWVTGSRGAKLASGLLSYIADSEFEKKSLAQETLERYRELNLFYQISEKLSECRDLASVIGIVAEEIKKRIEFDNLIVMTRNEDTLKLEKVYDHMPSQLSRSLHSIDSIITSVVESGRAEIINDLQEDKRCLKLSDRIRSMIVAPLSVKNRITGIIAIYGSKRNIYKSNDLKFFNSISFQAAVAIENARLYEAMKETFFETVKTLAETIEKRDPYTGGHTHRVMNYSVQTGREMGLPEVEIARLKLAALMHDIGKIGISDIILQKSCNLTDEEYEVMKKHCSFGDEIIRNIRQLRDIIPGVRSHHERFDGNGYPDRLSGSRIPLIGRIICVTDAYDAMTSDRPYRKGLSRDYAMDELVRCSGAHFDPKIVDAFIRVLNRKSDGR
jgi:HD-GYP domain-containing protein (c-di-GMP phosphodiesterase class II)